MLFITVATEIADGRCEKTDLPLLANNNSIPKYEFFRQFHFHGNQSHFHKNGFTLRLALKQRHKATRKWPISNE